MIDAVPTGGRLWLGHVWLDRSVRVYPCVDPETARALVAGVVRAATGGVVEWSAAGVGDNPGWYAVIHGAAGDVHAYVVPSDVYGPAGQAPR